MTPWGTQEVAIKSLTGEISKEDKVKFLQEAAIMAQFRHPHIVRLLGAVTVDEPVGLCGCDMCSLWVFSYSGPFSVFSHF